MMSATGILQGNLAVIVISWLFGIVGIIANLYVIYISVWNKYFSGKFRNRFYHVHNILITNLALIDLFGCMYLLIIGAADTYYRNNHPHIYGCYFTNSCHNLTNPWTISPMCSVSRFLALITSIAPALITLYIAIDRYTKVIKFHIRYRFTKKRCKILVALAWLFAILLSTFMCIRALQLHEPHNFRNFNNICCFPNPHDFLFRMVSFAGFAVVIGSYFITIGLYLSILNSIQEARHKILDLRDRTNRNTKAAEIRLCIITGILAVTNLCSWLPALSLVASNITHSSTSIQVSITFYHLSLAGFFLMFMNSCANPITYIIFLAKNF